MTKLCFTKEELEELLEVKSTTDIAFEYDVTRGAIEALCEKFGLKDTRKQREKKLNDWLKSKKESLKK